MGGFEAQRALAALFEAGFAHIGMCLEKLCLVLPNAVTLVLPEGVGAPRMQGQVLGSAVSSARLGMVPGTTGGEGMGWKFKRDPPVQEWGQPRGAATGADVFYLITIIILCVSAWAWLWKLLGGVRAVPAAPAPL